MHRFERYMQHSYTVTHIAEVLKCTTQFASGSEQLVVNYITTDTRKIIFAPQSMFVAINGAHQNGHQYIQEAYQAGIRVFMVEQLPTQWHQFPAAYLVVNNTLNALQQLAAYHRSMFSYPVLAITGSNGKTVIKEWIWQLLHHDIHIVRSPRSYNSQIGVPLSVWLMNDTHQLAVFEAGISTTNEMGKLQQIIRPDIGIFTNIGSAHDEGFATRSEKIQEKLKLFTSCSVLIVSTDDEQINTELQDWSRQHPSVKLIRWASKHKQADVFIDIERHASFTYLKMQKGAQSLRITIPFTDEASIQNACTCMAFLVCIDRLSTEIIKRFELLDPVEMRLNLDEGINDCILINDSYSADLDSLQIALDFLQQQAKERKKVVIISDLEQTGLKEADLYAKVKALLYQHGITTFYSIGKHSGKYLQDAATASFAHTQDFLSHFKPEEFQHAAILLKGARRFEFERIQRMLSKQVHETRFEINLNAVVNNLNVYRRLLNPGIKLMAMVKASSYGAGSSEIARLLEFHRVDYFAVAYVDEGIQLRKSGVRLPIMVMNADPSAASEMIQYGLEPVLFNVHVANKWIQSIEGAMMGVHIELDTGMKRLGFDEKDIDGLIALLKSNPNLNVKSIFAHLAASEDSSHDDFTQQQILLFDQLSARLTSEIPYAVLKHTLNSSGITRYKQAQYDMVRLGIGLYGVDPSAVVSNELQPIGTLKTVITQLRHIESHETVGYNRKGTVHEPSSIATVAIGYADGYSRKLGNGKGYMLVNGQRANTIGSICMDMTMLNVTGIACKEGDEVIVFGKELLIETLAAASETIPYEVLTSISHRVKRVYTFE